MIIQSVILALICLMIPTVIACSNQKTNKDKEILLNRVWHIRSSEEVYADGTEISKEEFDVNGWYPVDAPVTVLAGLVKNKVYTDLYHGSNLEKVPKEPFQKSWWYRTVFDFDRNAGSETVRLIFEGINYKADIWLNGEKIAGSDEIINAFRMFDIDVSEKICAGGNALAVCVHPPRPGDFSIGFADWNPRPPDENMGIWRPVKLRCSGPVSINHPFVQTKLNLETLDEAYLTVSANLTNHTDKSVTGVVNGQIEHIRFSQQYTLDPHESKVITYDSEHYAALNMKNPRIWWPNHLGDPDLYQMTINVAVHDKVSDSQCVRFGVREIADYFNEEGHRGYKVNGHKVQIRGGGWTDDLLLADDDRRVEAQVKYARQMNLNTLRLEGFWGNSQKIFDAADENGLLVMIGWSCHWEWEDYLGKPVGEYMAIETKDEIEMMSQSFIDQVLWLRHHPGIFVWVFGSDRLLVPELEKKLVDRLKKADPTRPTLGACQSLTSTVTGPTGVKMFGPYAYVTPNYWYLDTKKGGAFGFNTETGPGAQPPPVESIRKMLPLEKHWPVNEDWNYHCARKEFGSLDRYLNALNHRYGDPQDLEDFALKAQMANYEAMRAMFEAFAVNKHKATGIIQWMYNSAWPAMYWQLFDWYLKPSGAFYGAQNACEPVNLVYNYGDHAVYLINATLKPVQGLTAEMKLLNLNSEIVAEKRWPVQAKMNHSKKIYDLASLDERSPVYFLDLKLFSAAEKLIQNNFYWLSSKEEVLDFEKSAWYYTPNKAYADFTSIHQMPEADIVPLFESKTDGKETQVIVTLHNRSETLAFFIELDIVAEKSGQSVLPVFWEDNYISVLPDETRMVTGSFANSDLKEDRALLKLNGWNLKQHKGMVLTHAFNEKGFLK